MISCKDNGHKIEENTKKSTINDSQIDFFSKKYFKGYFLVIDESNLSDHPFFSYLNSKTEGYFAVHFIPKNKSLLFFWKEEYYKNFDFNNLDLKVDSEKIKKILKNKFTDYNIYCYHIKREYLDVKYGSSEESVNLKKGSFADIYLYNQDQKKWQLKKHIASDILPPYVNSNFFIDLFPSQFNLKSTDLNYQQKEETIDDYSFKDINWALDCDSNTNVYFDVIGGQFSCPERFCMNAELKKIGFNTYEFYFTDFPPIIPRSEEMQNWNDLDKTRSIGVFEIKDEKTIAITWNGFYHKKLKKFIETENPFTNKIENTPILLHKCQ